MKCNGMTNFMKFMYVVIGGLAAIVKCCIYRVLGDGPDPCLAGSLAWKAMRGRILRGGDLVRREGVRSQGGQVLIRRGRSLQLILCLTVAHLVAVPETKKKLSFICCHW